MAKRGQSLEESRFAPTKRSPGILPREFSKQTSPGNPAKTTLIFQIAIVLPSRTEGAGRPVLVMFRSRRLERPRQKLPNWGHMALDGESV